jgi:hypothetical protein
MVAEGRLVAIKGHLSAPLADALEAVPGVPVEVRNMSWALRVGPDRAESVRRVAVHHGVEMNAASLGVLADLSSQRELSDPVVEVRRGDGVWLSLMDDWLSLAVEELRGVPGTRTRSTPGRIEVPLAPWSAAPIERTICAHRLKLSPAAARALEEVKASGAAAAGAERGAGAEGRVEPESIRQEKTSACVPAAPEVRMDPGGMLVLAAEPSCALANTFARLPGARSWGGERGRWLVPATPDVARTLRGLAGEPEAIAFDADAERWLLEAPRWIARIDVERTQAGPVMRVTTRWGNPPPELETLKSLETRAAHLEAPLSVRNLGVLARVLSAEEEVSLATGVENALRWLGENPDAGEVPAAELDLIQEHSGSRLRVDAIWDDEPERAFAQQELALLRRTGELKEAAELPAEAWPPATLARFLRIHGVACTPAAARLVEGAVASDADAERLIALSSASDADVRVEGLGGDLIPFQRAGVAYALERRRLFLADEQGLGKTIQALATVQSDGAYPAVVICPASLKLNWVREIGCWLPGRTCKALSGRAAQELDGADIFVLNYEIVAAHLDSLKELAPQALIIDEAHYVKNSKAARTKAVLGLAEDLGPDALRLALTGTPIVNRPAELAPQLRVLDRLRELGSASSFTHGYNSQASRRRLHQRLRSSCYLRRRKTDVLTQLPDKRRAVITVPLDNHAEYRRAEQDFIHWLTEQLGEEGTERLAPSARAQAIVRMTALRRLAARGKLAAALSWLEDFLESEERLVVFAHHRDIQSEVSARFPRSARISGEDSVEEREENVRRFQAEDGPQLCVCSLEVASHGFTLTSAANVAFLELGWTPAKHDQAEDRLHRIGQTSRVTAWYLLAAETIDERIAALLASKREVVDSLTDGGSGEGESLANAILAGYAETTDRDALTSFR